MDQTILIDASIIAAWWGAIVASVVLLWDVYKWLHKGPRISIKATPNMRGAVVGSIPAGPFYLYIEVSNTGDAQTTISALEVCQAKSRLHLLFNKTTNHGSILRNDMMLPHEIKAGGLWQSKIDQADLREKLDENNKVYCSIKHTFSAKPVYSEIDISSFKELPND
jgi:hypothetical protein